MPDGAFFAEFILKLQYFLRNWGGIAIPAPIRACNIVVFGVIFRPSGLLINSRLTFKYFPDDP